MAAKSCLTSNTDAPQDDGFYFANNHFVLARGADEVGVSKHLAARHRTGSNVSVHIRIDISLRVFQYRYSEPLSLENALKVRAGVFFEARCQALAFPLGLCGGRTEFEICEVNGVFLGGAEHIFIRFRFRALCVVCIIVIRLSLRLALIFRTVGAFGHNHKVDDL